MNYMCRPWMLLAVALLLLAPKSFAQMAWGSGMWGGMQSCNYELQVGSEATSIADDIRELKKDKAELESQIKELQADKKELKDRIKDNQSRFSDYGPGKEGTDIEIKSMVQPENRVHFSVFNQGTSISPSVIDKISKPFFLDEDVMYHSTGMGLGLTVCTSIINAHAGHLKIENISNGVEVSFELMHT